jgi:hypothetical protein
VREAEWGILSKNDEGNSVKTKKFPFSGMEAE